MSAQNLENAKQKINQMFGAINGEFGSFNTFDDALNLAKNFPPQANMEMFIRFSEQQKAINERFIALRQDMATAGFTGRLDQIRSEWVALFDSLIQAHG